MAPSTRTRGPPARMLVAFATLHTRGGKKIPTARTRECVCVDAGKKKKKKKNSVYADAVPVCADIGIFFLFLNI
jgi:hypothetical protein